MGSTMTTSSLAQAANNQPIFEICKVFHLRVKIYIHHLSSFVILFVLLNSGSLIRILPFHLCRDFRHQTNFMLNNSAIPAITKDDNFLTFEEIYDF